MDLITHTSGLAQVRSQGTADRETAMSKLKKQLHELTQDRDAPLLSEVGTDVSIRLD